MSIFRRTLWAAFSFSCAITANGADRAKNFDRTVAPILSAHCLTCHSGTKPKGQLDLSRRATAQRGGDSGSVIVPGKLEESYLWELIEADDMPPKRPLAAEEKKVIRDWIASGANCGSDPIDPFQYSSRSRAGYDWWSLQPLMKTPAPEVDDDRWSQNEVDRYIFSTLTSKGLTPSPRADARTLVRRIYIDLIGLPAPVEVIDRFAKEPSPEAWERIVDGLLASKHYGERWARHWMNVVRFGESDGYEYNRPRENSWHYRDWLIRALNDDMPYDQFTRMQLAGDWLSYGLGNESDSLPTFVVLPDARSLPNGGASNWSSGFLPARHQGTLFGSGSQPIRNLFANAKVSNKAETDALGLLDELNQSHLALRGGNDLLKARIKAYELAAKMQVAVPEAIDFANESESLKRMYGLDRKQTSDCGRRCLLARRLLERGVRFVQLYSGGAFGGKPRHGWDGHDDNRKNHEREAGLIDQPIAALITDLRQRGMLDDTLVLCTSEFGRTPFTQSAANKLGLGRDQQSYMARLPRHRFAFAGHQP